MDVFTLITQFLPLHTAADGTSWPTAEEAMLHDAMPQLCDPQMLIAAREEFHLSRRQLAQLVGVSPTLLKYVEQGKRKFTANLAFRLWPVLYKLDSERKSYKTPEVLVRIEHDCLVATERIRLSWVLHE